MSIAMTFVSEERMPAEEIELRHERCRALLSELHPEAGGLLVFSRTNLYYLTGSLANGLFWLPREGAPVLLCRRGLERSRLDSPLEVMRPYRSFSDIPAILAEAGSPLTDAFGVEATGLSWSMGLLFAKRLADYRLVPADRVLERARAVKTEWELVKMRRAGHLHDLCLSRLLPERIEPGMTERDIAHVCLDICLDLGMTPISRSSGPGVELMFGHVSAGDSGIYPSFYDGPLGLRGLHPSVPYMGSPLKVWEKNEPLAVDTAFCFEGYNTDKTQIFWSGPARTIPEQARIAHQLCLDIQDRAAAEARPGTPASPLYANALEQARQAGFEDGFMGLGGNKTVFLGHGIGLQVDEYPPLAKGERLLEAGMTLAIEPKIGLPGFGMVGIENTYEITEQGGRPLTGTDHDIVCMD